MTIDEAIEQERDGEDIARGNIIKSNNLDGYESWHNSECINCAEEHEQLAEWLEELKFIRQWKSDVTDEFCKYDASSFEELITNVRNKAIDDFVNTVKATFPHDNIAICNTEVIAEQLKEGGENGKLSV